MSISRGTIDTRRHRPIAVYTLSVVLALQSLSALICGAAMIADPSGASMQLPAAVLDDAPFANFLIPGIFLFVCLGVLPLFAMYALLVKNEPDVWQKFNFYADYRAGWMLSLFCGFGTLIWITAQLYFTRTFHPLQTFYSAVGMLILILALLPATMRYCRRQRPNRASRSL